ncbi:MAG: nucleotidyltransferase domain-containing protein [Oscillospiraceae bacterium]|nr:nucleotidyltransferase domain-containing protein [Oscillospiraceae bacterium]
MLTHEKIVAAVKKAANEFPLTKAEYFGSYADGRATEKSDLDLLVEFEKESVCLLEIIGLKQYLEEELDLPVDIIHAPLPQGAIIHIERTVRVL